MNVSNDRLSAMKQIFAYAWKLPICGVAFFIGMAVSGVLLPVLGFKSPQLPAGTDANTITLWFLVGSMILAFVLSFVSRGLQVKWLGRSVILFLLVWIFGAVGMVIESFFFMTTGAVASATNVLFTILNFLLPSLFLSVLSAALFRPELSMEPCHRYLRTYFYNRKTSAWLWRFGVAWLAYPLTYFTFGLIVNPFIQEFYSLEQYETGYTDLGTNDPPPTGPQCSVPAGQPAGGNLVAKLS